MVFINRLHPGSGRPGTVTINSYLTILITMKIQHSETIRNHGGFRMKRKLTAAIILVLLILSAAACGIPEDEKKYSSELLKSDIFRAEPAVIRDCLGENGKTTLYWKVPDVRKVEIHVESADGNLFTISGPDGSKETGYWVRDGMKFVLLDADSGKELATIKVKVLCGS